MAKQDHRPQQLKQQLIAELAAQRVVLATRAKSLDTTARTQIRETTDIRALCKKSISRHPVAWASATAVAAFAATRLLLGKRQSRTQKSSSHAQRSALPIPALLGFFGKLAIKALRPAVEKAIRERISATFGEPRAKTFNP